MTATPCIITCAITGSLPKKADNPTVPITPQVQVESTHEAFEAGATLVHLHVRNDDGTPTSSPDRFARVLEGLRQHCPGIIVQFSTGGRSGAGRERGAHLELRPDDFCARLVATDAAGLSRAATRLPASTRRSGLRRCRCPRSSSPETSTGARRWLWPRRWLRRCLGSD